MKKIIKLLLIICVISIFNNVKAANYELKELIPINTETTIVTNHFSYQSFSYKSKDVDGNNKSSNYIIFKNIKNISDDDLPISISIALFDKDLYQ